MSTVLRLSSCLLIATALAGCNKSEPAAPAATAETPAATADASAPQAATAPAAGPADEAAPIALSMDKVKTYVQALKNLGAAHKADPSIDPAQNISEENTGQFIARLEANPKTRAAIESAGMSASDFARTGDTLIGAMMANAALEAGQLKTLPDGIDPAAVEFVKQHQSEIQELMGAAEAGS